jgi:DNA polymerase III subunit epsilon
MLCATHAAPRLVLARHPVKERFDVFWVVRGRLVDWGALPGHTELVERTRAALAHPPGRTVVPVDEVDEIRIVASWVADNEPPGLPLDPAPRAPALMRFAASATTEPAAAPPPASGSPATAPATSAGSGALQPRR